MQKRFRTIIFLTFLCLLFGFYNADAQVSKKRQLKLYEKGGNFDFGWSVREPSEREKLRTKLKEFLRTRFEQRKLARVTTAFYSLEGDPFFSVVYVEPAANGNWQIVEYWERFCCVLYNLGKIKRKPVKAKGKIIYESFESYEASLREQIPF